MFRSHEQLLIRAALASPFLKQLLVASAICEGFRAKGWDPLILGETALAIHTQGRYVATHLSMVVGDHPDVDDLMGRLGFVRKTKAWHQPDLNLTLPEMPSEIDPQSRIHEVVIEGTSVPVVAPEDAVIERLTLLRDTRDVKHGLSALLVALSNPELDLEYLMLQAYRASVFEGLLGLRELTARYLNQQAPTRTELETKLRELF